jgi:hypothetical protein
LSYSLDQQYFMLVPKFKIKQKRLIPLQFQVDLLIRISQFGACLISNPLEHT